MDEAETYRVTDDGRFPNSVLPLLVYRAVLPPDRGRPNMHALTLSPVRAAPGCAKLRQEVYDAGRTV